MASILAEVIQARDATSGDEFKEMLENTSMKLTQVKTDLIESLQSVFVLHEADIDRVTSWYEEVRQIRGNIDELKDTYEGDQSAMKLASENVDIIEDELQHLDQQIHILQSLVDIMKCLSMADPSEYYKASKLVQACQKDFKITMSHFNNEEDRRWVISIKSKIADLITDIYERTSKELWSIFKFSKNCAVIKIKKEIPQLLQTVVNLGYSSRILSKLTSLLWQELLSKACSPDYVINVSGKPKPSGTASRVRSQKFENVPSGDHKSNINTGNGVTSHTFNCITVEACKSSAPIRQIDQIFGNINSVIDVFYSVLRENASLMDEFAEIISPKLCSELSKQVLNNLVFKQAGGNKEDAKENIALLRKLMEDLSITYGLQLHPDSTLMELEDNFEALFFSNLRQNLIVRIRELVQSNLHDTEEVSFDETQHKVYPAEMYMLHRNPSAFTKCVVSKSVIVIVQLLEKHLTTYPEDLALVEGAFNLYISLMKVPKHESDVCDLAPFSAVLLHNNCHFLAHHACFTFPMSEDKVPELRSKATQAYSFMLRSVRTKINSLIVEAMGGIMNEEEQNVDSEIGMFLKISAEFIRLHGMFKNVLPFQILQKTLATLIDHTVNELCSKVIAFDDISAVCGNKLSSAFTQLAIETSDVMNWDSLPQRELEALMCNLITKWSRFKQITFVLTASMKQIGDRWVGGCGPLAEVLKAEELRKLVRALFQNTDRRAAFLSSIK